MKLFTLFLCLISMSTVAGLPPTTLVGNDSGESNLFFKLKVPNAQSTKLADGAIIETGNENILANPSFESNRSTTGYAWSVSGATASLDTTNQIHGKNALSLALSSTLNLNQSAATNAANTVGLQAVASVYIKSSLADVNVCSIINNVEDKCVQYNGTNTWVKIEIPFIFGATQNGIKIKTTSSTSGTVLVDNAFVGLSSPFQNVSGARLVGALTYSPALNCIWQTTSATFANFAADTDCSTPTVTGNIKAPSTKIPAIVLPTGSQSGTYLITAKAMFYKGTGGYASYRFSDGTNSVNAGSSSYADNTATGVISGQITYSTSINSDTTIQIQGKTGTGNLSVYSSDTTDGLYIEVYYFPPESKIYSQASQDYDWTAYTPTFTGFGTVASSECFHKRKGSDLFLRCKFTSGTPTATEARISLPNSLVSANSSLIPSISVVGSGGVNINASTFFENKILIEPSVGYVTIGQQTSTTASLTKINGTAFASTNILSFTAGPIPIQGWQDYGVIVGSFQYVPQVPGQSNVDVFSVSYGTTNATTVCSASPCSYLDQIGNAVSSITRSALGTYSINLNKTYSKLKCSATVNTSAGVSGTQGLVGGYVWACNSCNSLTVATGIQNTAQYDTFGTIYCQGSY